MADRGMAAQLEQNGITFCTEPKRVKLETYAAFLRARHPDRTFEVRVVELPESLKRFQVEE
jgi:hypothetical protein